MDNSMFHLKIEIDSLFTQVHKNLRSHITSCGELSSKEAKQSEANKEYFSAQAKEYQKSVELLKELKEQIEKFFK